MKKILDWIAMGGYATTVWSAYGICFFVLILQFYLVWKAYKNAQTKT